MTRCSFFLFTGLTLICHSVGAQSATVIKSPASASKAWITFTIRNNSLRQTDQLIYFTEPGQTAHHPFIGSYRFGPYSALTFTYPVGTKIECIQRVDLQGRPTRVRLLTMLKLSDQGRTLKLSL